MNKVLVMLITEFNKIFNIALYIFSFFYLTRTSLELIEGQWINQVNLLLLGVSVVGAFYGRKRHGLVKAGIFMGILSKIFMWSYVN